MMCLIRLVIGCWLIYWKYTVEELAIRCASYFQYSFIYVIVFWYVIVFQRDHRRSLPPILGWNALYHHHSFCMFACIRPYVTEQLQLQHYCGIIFGIFSLISLSQ